MDMVAFLYEMASSRAVTAKPVLILQVCGIVGGVVGIIACALISRIMQGSRVKSKMIGRIGLPLSFILNQQRKNLFHGG